MAHSVVEGYLERPARYRSIDGTDELTVGGVYLWGGVFGYVESLLPSKPHGFASLVTLGAVTALFLLAGYLAIRAIKRRITWPRTGYMAPRDTGKNRTLAFVGGAVAVVAVWILYRFAGGADLAAPVMHCMLYAMLAFRFRREHPWKWCVLVFLAAGMGFITLAARGEQFWRRAAWFAAFTWLASGGITLYLYMRHTKPAGAEAE